MDGHVVDVVHGLVQGGVGIKVGAELHADVLQVAEQSVVGEVLGSVEAHVLKEVCQSALVFLFEHRAYLLGNVEVGLSFGKGIVADVVGESVFEFAYTHVGVGGYGLCLLGKHIDAAAH